MSDKSSIKEVCRRPTTFHTSHKSQHHWDNATVCSMGLRSRPDRLYQGSTPSVQPSEPWANYL